MAAWALVVLAALCRCTLLTGVALASWTVVPGLVGFQATTVMSGSMAPRFQVGDAVVAKPVSRADLAVGQVLLFDDPDRPGALRLHRLVQARGDRLVTRGDANGSDDSSPIGFAAVRGAGFVRIPGAGLPTYWLRTGQVQPLVLLGVAAIALAWGGRLDRRFVSGRHVDRRIDRAGRRRPRHRWTAAVPLVLVVALSGALVAHDAVPASARFSTRTSNGRNAFPACWDWPLRGTLPSSALAYFNYMERSGSTTANRAAGGAAVNTFGTVVRNPGTCTVDGSPSVALGSAGASGVIASSATTMPAAVTIATWFRTSTPSGTIADLGNSQTGTTGSTLHNVVLYLNANGAVVVGAPTVVVGGLVTGVTTCRSSDGYANGGWHLVIATFSSAGCTIAVDGVSPSGSAATNSTSLNLQLLSGSTYYWRLGYDTIPNVYTGQGSTPWFTGDLDETQVYSSVLTTAQQQAIVDRRR